MLLYEDTFLGICLVILKLAHGIFFTCSLDGPDDQYTVVSQVAGIPELVSLPGLANIVEKKLVLENIA